MRLMENEKLIRQLADQKFRIEALQRELLLKNQCLSLIAHDFSGVSRNFLWLINALGEGTISLEIFKELYPELKANVLANHKTIESAVAWVNSQHETYVPNTEEINFFSLFNHIKHFFVDYLETKNINLYYYGDEDPSSYGDLVLIQFILKALVENAIKYSMAGGDITFEVKSSDKNISVAVIDSGVGMNKEALDNIFTLDGAPNSGTANEKGSGLSLIIANDFVRLVGGQIHISSVEGQGTRVELLLPHSQEILKDD